MSGLAICGNGAISNGLAWEVIATQATLAPAVAGELITDRRAAIAGITFAREAGLRYGEEPNYAPSGREPAGGELQIAEALMLSAAG